MIAWLALILIYVLILVAKIDPQRNATRHTNRKWEQI